jgi:hypothetical protein
LVKNQEKDSKNGIFPVLNLPFAQYLVGIARRGKAPLKLETNLQVIAAK